MFLKNESQNQKKIEKPLAEAKAMREFHVVFNIPSAWKDYYVTIAIINYLTYIEWETSSPQFVIELLPTPVILRSTSSFCSDRIGLLTDGYQKSIRLADGNIWMSVCIVHELQKDNMEWKNNWKENGISKLYKQYNKKGCQKKDLC